MDEYGYKKDDLAANFPIRMGREKKYAGICVFLEGKHHIQESILIIIEAKRADVKPTDKKLGTEQLKSCMSASVNCTFGLWVGESKEAFEKITADGQIQLVPAFDIPRRGHRELERPRFDGRGLPALTRLQDTA